MKVQLPSSSGLLGGYTCHLIPSTSLQDRLCGSGLIYGGLYANTSEYKTLWMRLGEGQQSIVSCEALQLGVGELASDGS